MHSNIDREISLDLLSLQQRVQLPHDESSRIVQFSHIVDRLQRRKDIQ